MNDDLATVNWDDIGAYNKELATNIYNGLNKFELHKGINVTRITDTKIFGKKGMTFDEVQDAINSKGGNIQVDTFLSTGANSHGASIAGSGVQIKFHIPPSKGAGAYVNPISLHKGSGENEFLINNNGVFHFHKDTLKQLPSGQIYVEATWLGQAKKQAFFGKGKKKGKK